MILKKILLAQMLMAGTLTALASPASADPQPKAPAGKNAGGSSDKGSNGSGKTGAVPNSVDTPTVPPNTPDAGAAPSDANALPKAQSDHDKAPPVAEAGVDLPKGGIISQAGIGGNVAYGRAGVLELGGSAGLSWATNYRNINFSPSVGWFIADDIQLSAILSVSNIKVNDNSSTLWSAIAEPSYHAPLNRSVFVFGGLGLGASHAAGSGTGFALLPRVGMNFMVGRSGILSPAVTYEYITSQDDSGALLINFGYTVMW